jgi:RNA polymerase sigma-70 factor (ECF subfamily)
MTWVTTTALLAQLTAGEDDAWDRFAERYREPVLHFARRLGIREGEAEDVAQDTLVAFLDAWRKGRYDRDKGRIGSFLFAIASQQVRSFHRKAQRARPQGVADTAFWRELPDEAGLRDSWDVSWAKTIFERCLDRARRELEPSSVRAFELTVLDERPVKEVASELGLTANAVYIAKHRVLARIKELREGYEHVA